MISPFSFVTRAIAWLFRPAQIEGFYPDGLTGKLQDELSLESFKSCRQLVIENIKILEKNETFVLGAVVAVVVFCLGRPSPLYDAQFFLLPIIWLLGVWRFWALKQVIDLGDDFTKLVEGQLPLGWTTYYKAHSTGDLGRSRWAFWLIVAVCGGGYLLFCGVCGPPTVSHVSGLPGLQKV